MNPGTTAQSAEIPLRNIITTHALLDHWQGHRRLTRRVIEPFPEEQLFHYSIGGMRPFASMVLEFISMAEPGIDGVATGVWKNTDELPHHRKTSPPSTKKGLLERWDFVTEKINRIWPTISSARFMETDTAFGQWEGPVLRFMRAE